MNTESESQPLTGVMNNELIRREDGIVKSVFSESRKVVDLNKHTKNSKDREREDNLDKANMLIQDKSHKVMSDNPYSDTKVRTTYAWNMDTEAFQFVKGSQNLYNNSIKKKNYFHPHVGAHGGAGGMRTYKCRDTTPMKFTLTTMSHSTNPAQNDVISVSRLNTQAGTSLNRQKARELKITGGSMKRKDVCNMMFPKVQKINNSNYTKVLLNNSLFVNFIYRMTDLLELQKSSNPIKLKLSRTTGTQQDLMVISSILLMFWYNKYYLSSANKIWFTIKSHF